MVTTRGVAFVEVDGDRSSTRAGQAVFVEAARAVDPSLADRISSERDWYGTYDRHARALEQAQLTAPQATVEVARRGLAAMREQLEFVRDGGAVAVDTAPDLEPSRRLGTAVVEGAAARVVEPALPYGGRVLRGPELASRLDAWVAGDVVEPEVRDAVRRVMATPDWLDLRDQQVVVMGGASEMGPLEWLARWGATTIVVDLQRPRLWEGILADVRAGSGRCLVPVADPDADPASSAGADLLTELPEVWRWLEERDGPLVMGNYVYAHGSVNVQVSAAVDVLVDRVLARRGGSSVAVLATPTDVYAVPDPAVEASRRRWESRPTSRRLANRVSGGRLFAPNYPDDGSGRDRHVVDSQITQQGCNYSLAKRLHRWRALVARDAGSVSSINVAPATRTRSVTDNRVLKAAYAAAPTYDIEVFEPDTARALMALLLVHDLRAPDAASRPRGDLDHPLMLLADHACHGGLWRTPYAPGTVLPLAAARGLVRPSTWTR